MHLNTPSMRLPYVAAQSDAGGPRYHAAGQAGFVEVDVHELSVCQALLAQVEEISRNNGDAAVDRITIEMGPLSGIDAQQLRNAFEIMRLGGRAANAELWVTQVEVLIECLACRRRCAASPNRLVCATCGGFRTQVVAGDELRLLRVEMTS